MEVDRLELYDALSALSPIIPETENRVHGWNQDFGQLFKLDSITVHGLRICRIPFSTIDIARLTSFLKRGSSDGNQQGVWYAKNIMNFLDEFHHLSYQEVVHTPIGEAFKQKFGSGLEDARIRVHCEMRGLALISKPSGIPMKIPDYLMREESLGTILLHLPVEHEPDVSANIYINHNGEEKSLSYQQKPPFYVTFVTGNIINSTEVSIQSVGNVPAVFLVYDLIWLKPHRLITDCDRNFFASFVEKLKKLKLTLVNWENAKVDPLCLPTRNVYKSNEFLFEKLKPEDLRMVILLKTIDFIDVSLAILKMEHVKWNTSDPLVDWRKESDRTEEKNFSVHRWVQGDWMFSSDVHEKFTCLRFDRHLLGDVTSALEDDNCEDELAGEKPNKIAKLDDFSRSPSYHTAIVIRPRKAAIFDCWNHCPVKTLQCLTERVNATLFRNDDVVLECRLFIEAVTIIIELVIEEDKSSDCQRTAILHQLLYLCTRLKATDEGLRILEVIPQRQCECRQAHVTGFKGFFGGSKITIEDVIADLVSLAGWEKCSVLLYSMYSRYDDADSNPFYKLSRELNNRGFIDGAVSFAKRCLRAIPAGHHVAYDEESSWHEIYYFINLSLSEAIDEERKEILALLESVAMMNSTVLHVMIERYFHLRHTCKKKPMAGLELSIRRLITQIDRYSKAAVAFSAICFAYGVKDAQLEGTVWSRLLNSQDDQQKNDFKEMLSDYDSYDCSDYITNLYEAIAHSPLATETFYECIGQLMKKTDGHRYKYWDFEACFYHLMMAETVPNLGTGKNLKAVLSAFKEMDVDLLADAGVAMVNHNDRHWESGHVIAQRIQSIVLQGLCTRDLASLLSQETPGFGRAMYFYIKQGDNSAKLRLLDTLEKNLLPEDELVAFGNDTDTLLFTTWLHHLISKLDDGEANRRVAVYQMIEFFTTYCDVNEIGCLVGADAKCFTDFSNQLTVEVLEKVLLGLYERERSGTSQCLKACSFDWYICNALSDLFVVHLQRTSAMSDLAPERIVKLVCCIFWIGSSVATNAFASLFRTLPIATARYCLSLFVLSNEELQHCAISSPYAFDALRHMVRHCIGQLFADVGCASSWSRRNATNVDHLPSEVKEFYQSEEKSKRFGPFKTLNDACQFVKSAAEGLPWTDYTVSENGNSYVCELTKLYPVIFDTALSSVTPYLSDVLCTPYSDFFGEAAERLIEISELKCSICLAPCLKALRS